MSSEAAQEHTRQVDAWIERNTGGLSPERLVALFIVALETLWKRASVTLSEVTLSPIFDRAVTMSQGKYPLLAGLKIDSPEISAGGLGTHAQGWKPEEIIVAFRHLMIELLQLLGRLTADILTKALYEELNRISSEHAIARAKTTFPALRSVKKNSDRGDP